MVERYRNIQTQTAYILTFQENDENKISNDEMSKVDALVVAVGTDEDVVSHYNIKNTQIQINANLVF